MSSASSKATSASSPSSAVYTIKNATYEDFGYSYDVGAELTKWPRPYRAYRVHAGLNKELEKVTAVRKEILRNGIEVHSAMLQPYVKPKPGAKPSEDRLVYETWDIPGRESEGCWTFVAVFDGMRYSSSRLLRLTGTGRTCWR
jgi:hypothetical protein